MDHPSNNSNAGGHSLGSEVWNDWIWREMDIEMMRDLVVFTR